MRNRPTPEGLDYPRDPRSGRYSNKWRVIHAGENERGRAVALCYTEAEAVARAVAMTERAIWQGRSARYEAARNERVWDRRAGSRTYHMRAFDWVETGRAQCGADISHAAFTVDSLAGIEAITVRKVKACGHCK